MPSSSLIDQVNPSREAGAAFPVRARSRVHNVRRRTAIAMVALAMAVPVADAAQVCFSAAGTYGGLTVTQSGSGCGTFLTYGGITNGLYMGSEGVTESCTFGVSPSVVGNTIKVTLTAHSCNGTSYCEEARFSLNGTHYVVAPTDLLTPIPAGGSPVQITSGGDIVEAPGGSSAGSGQITFNSAPSSVSSITIQHAVTLGAPAGTIYEVCADDAGGTTPTATTTAVTSTPNPSTLGQSVTLTATVAGVDPTGTVQFRDGSTDLGAPVALSGGTAVLTTSLLTVGTHSITALYGGDGNDAPSTSPAATHTVVAAVTAQEIPTLSEWALLLLGALLAALGISRWRRGAAG